MRIALKIAMKKSKENAKGHLHVIKDDVALKPLKPVSDFASLKQN
ncbi:hypothetical protein [Lactiplantibacillus plantarum]